MKKIIMGVLAVLLTVGGIASVASPSLALGCNRTGCR
jgi:uncharacterized protein YxeA